MQSKIEERRYQLMESSLFYFVRDTFGLVENSLDLIFILRTREVDHG